jgi:hypothetical protein
MDEELSLLQYYAPGILLSITIPYRTGDSKSYNYHINIKNELLKHIRLQEDLLIAKEAAATSIDNVMEETITPEPVPTIIESAPIAPAGDMTQKPANGKPKKIQPTQPAALPTMMSLTSAIAKNQRRSRLDDIIEKMERKYTTLSSSNPQMLPNDYSDEEDSESDENPNPATNSTEMTANEPNDTKKSKSSKSKSNKRKRFSEQDFYDLDDDFIDDSEHVEDIETIVRMKYKTKQDGFFVSSGDIEVIEESEEDMVDDESDEIGNASESETDADQQDQVIRKKPEWSPNEELQSALDRFKQDIESLELKPLPRNAHFPVEVNQPLLALDQEVRRSYRKPVDVSSSLSHYDYLMVKQSGYLEFIVESLGSQISIMKVKRQIQKLQLKEESNSLKGELDREVSLLKAAIKDNISLAPPPKLAATTVTADPVVAEVPAAAPEPAAVALTLAASSSSSSSHENDDTGIDKHEGEPMDVSQQESVVREVGQLETNNDPRSSEMKAVQSPVSPTTPKPKQAKQKPVSEPVIYKYRCRWNGHMRASLLKIEDDMNKYVEVENKYRAKLTQLEMIDMEDNDVSYSSKPRLMGDNPELICSVRILKRGISFRKSAMILSLPSLLSALMQIFLLCVDIFPWSDRGKLTILSISCL